MGLPCNCVSRLCQRLLRRSHHASENRYPMQAQVKIDVIFIGTRACAATGYGLSSEGISLLASSTRDGEGWKTGDGLKLRHPRKVRQIFVVHRDFWRRGLFDQTVICSPSHNTPGDLWQLKSVKPTSKFQRPASNGDMEIHLVGDHSF